MFYVKGPGNRQEIFQHIRLSRFEIESRVRRHDTPKVSNQLIQRLSNLSPADDNRVGLF